MQPVMVLIDSPIPLANVVSHLRFTWAQPSIFVWRPSDSPLYSYLEGSGAASNYVCMTSPDMLSKQEIDELLEQREGRSLDFKRDQYAFESADDESKSELLKDILAFANTARMHDAYILIGVREVKDGVSIPVGVSVHLDDAKLQQFVNTKTNRPVRFSYEANPFAEMSLGVIRIDRDQPAPIWITKPYGKLQKDRVYIRHGTSTTIASPDEIVQLGASKNLQPARVAQLSFSFYLQAQEERVKILTAERTLLLMPSDDEIPEPGMSMEGPGGIIYNIPSPHLNSHFYRDAAKYFAQLASIVPAAFCIENSGNGSASDVVIQLRVSSNASDGLNLFWESDLLRKPPRNFTIPNFANPIPRIPIKRTKTGWSCEFSISKVLAKQRILLGDILYFHSTKSASISIELGIFANELSSPVRDHLAVNISTTERKIDISQLYRLCRGI
jgi:hypothetical protein